MKDKMWLNWQTTKKQQTTMQRLVSQKLAFSFSKNAFSLHSHFYKSFDGIPKVPKRDPLVGYNSFHHYRSSNFNHSLSETTRVRGFLSNPLLGKEFCRNFSIKGPNDSRVGFFKTQFSRGRHGFGSDYGYYQRDWKSWFERLSENDVILGLIIANVSVFMLWNIADQKFMVDNFMISLDNIKSWRLHTMITSAFSHKDIVHLISNMIGLYFFGTSIASNFGTVFLLKLYLAGAIGGSIFYVVHHAYMASTSKGQGMWSRDPSRTPGLGASGAVNAIMLLNIFLNPRATIYFDFIFPVPAMLLGVFLIGKDMLRIIQGDRSISGSAHLGGAAVAALAWVRIRKGRF